MRPLENGQTMQDMAQLSGHGVVMEDDKVTIEVKRPKTRSHLIFGSVTQPELDSKRWADLAPPEACNFAWTCLNS